MRSWPFSLRTRFILCEWTQKENGEINSHHISYRIHLQFCLSLPRTYETQIKWSKSKSPLETFQLVEFLCDLTTMHIVHKIMALHSTNAIHVALCGSIGCMKLQTRQNVRFNMLAQAHAWLEEKIQYRLSACMEIEHQLLSSQLYLLKLPLAELYGGT